MNKLINYESISELSSGSFENKLDCGDEKYYWAYYDSPNWRIYVDLYGNNSQSGGSYRICPYFYDGSNWVECDVIYKEVLGGEHTRFYRQEDITVGGEKVVDVVGTIPSIWKFWGRKFSYYGGWFYSYRCELIYQMGGGLGVYSEDIYNTYIRHKHIIYASNTFEYENSDGNRTSSARYNTYGEDHFHKNRGMLITSETVSNLAPKWWEG